MKYVFTVDTNGYAKSIGKIMVDTDEVVAVHDYPPREYRPGYTAALKYDPNEGLYWEYTQIPAAQMRENAYETYKCISYENALITVDEANKLWEEYEAEGSRRAEELTDLIAAAKARIRELYPDEN